MYCAPLNFPFCDKALFHDKGMLTNPNAGSLRLSYNSKSNFSLERNRAFDLFDYFMNGGSKLNCYLKLRTSSQSNTLVVKSNHPQNTDPPKYHSRKVRKPFPVPIVELRRAARARLKETMNGAPRRPVPPPKRGLLVKSLIPLAYDVFHARIMLINNINKLLKVVPVLACRWCNELHVGSIGHPFRSCKAGQEATRRNGMHQWTNATLDDVFIPMEAYHLHDRLMRRIPHYQRFSVPRIPALIELCIQAGVDIPEFPTKRRRKPIIRISKGQFINADESELPDPEPNPNPNPDLSEIPFSKIPPPSDTRERVSVAEETLALWDKVRSGAKRLMGVYHVRVCGYCPELHVGPSGHKAQNCGAFKHQQRNGQHGWQAAVLDDFIPPRYVWHVPDGGELKRELRRFYGQAPAVVEMCAQGGAAVPEEHKSTMRLDVGIPKDEVEAEFVA